jgi:TolB-like protein/Tfp pilus assembly protein PilF
MTSSSDRWQHLESLFYAAAELQPPARKAFLDDRCAGDDELRAEVESLLASADQPIDFFEKPIRDAAQEVVSGRRQPALRAGDRFSRYEVVEAIGSGGMGEVYLARDTQLKRNIALKLLAPRLTVDGRGLRRFALEALAASALNHPNILTLYDFGQVEGKYYIASEYVEGDTLSQRIRQAALNFADVVDISMQVCSALAAAHGRGIVHRDIKPGNLMVRKDAIVKLLDFGIAKLTEDETGSQSATTSVLSVSWPGAVMGTVRYMSPEQARGSKVDERTDIFSLGVVMYEMLTGTAPFQGETASDIIAEILKVDPPALTAAVPGLPAQLDVIVMRAMRKSREERFQSAREMLDELQDFRRESEFQEKLQRSAGQLGTTPRGGLILPKAPAGGNVPGGRDSGQVQTTEATPRMSKQVLIAAALAILAAAVVTTSIARRRWTQYRGASTSRELAVLPFRNLRPDPQTDFLGFSLADEIITKLGYVSALTVRPSFSVEKYRNQIVDPQKAAAELQVGTLLTGTYLRDGDELRITAQLIDVHPAKILWQDTIDLKYDRLLTLQDTVARQIIKGLEVSLSPAEKKKLQPETTVSPEAYELYLRGVDLYASDEFPAAVKMLEKAVSIDPNYAPAWAHLGRAYTTNASLQFGGREQYAKAQAAYKNAIALDPGLIEVKVYMANLLTDTGQVEQAVPLLRNLLAEYPEQAEAHWELGYAYRFGGMLHDAVTESERARMNNPTVKANSAAMNAYLYLGEYDEFLQSLPASNTVYVIFYRGFGEYYLRHWADAARDFDHAYELDPTVLPADVGKALSYGVRGEHGKGLELLRATERRILDSGVSDAEGLYKVAQAYAVLGDKPAAILMFHRAIEGGFFPYTYFQTDPLLDNIRNEPEFDMLMREADERHEQFKKRFFRARGPR